MITRLWRGWTRITEADAYERLLRTTILSAIAARRIAGLRGVSLLRRTLADEVEFVTLMVFDAMADVRTFAGEDTEAAVVPPAARALLARFDARAAHYETVIRPGA